MTTNKNAMVKTQAKSNEKHSSPLFYVSSALFNNRRLKQKRSKWSLALAATAASGPAWYATAAKYKYTKTDRRKQSLSKLRADITINLLSDEEDDAQAPLPFSLQSSTPNAAHTSTPTALTGTTSLPLPPLAPISSLAPQSAFALYQMAIPNATDAACLYALPSPSNINALAAPPLTRQKSAFNTRKRKAHQPRRHAQAQLPRIVNNESILLSDSDDSDNDKPTAAAHMHPAAHLDLEKCSVAEAPTAAPSASSLHHNGNLPRIAQVQVDEEVTVSLVPRSSTAGSCVKPSANELFPMLPDETTVHTVIANRIYELSLTKLREGLASCGTGESEDKKQLSPTRQRKGKMPSATPPPTPISLKLSSDLSISLISDDDEDEQQPQEQQQHDLNHQNELLKHERERSQSTSPAQGQRPVTISVGGARPTPRRRKLG